MDKLIKIQNGLGDVKRVTPKELKRLQEITEQTAKMAKEAGWPQKAIEDIFWKITEEA